MMILREKVKPVNVLISHIMPLSIRVIAGAVQGFEGQPATSHTGYSHILSAGRVDLCVGFVVNA
jgi:hypothetical protein